MTRSKIGKYADLMGELRALSEEDSEEGKNAKRALKAIDGGDEPEETDEEKKKKDDEAKAKADEEKKEKEKAQAAITSLSGQVLELSGKLAERERREAADRDAQARAAIFAKRPDLNDAVRAALETMPTEALAKAVDALPRVSAAPYAAASASVPGVSGGERVQGGANARPLNADEQAVFDRSDPFKRNRGTAKATFQGSEFTMPNRMISAAEAAARTAELEKEMGMT